MSIRMSIENITCILGEALLLLVTIKLLNNKKLNSDKLLIQSGRGTGPMKPGNHQVEF